MVLSVSEDTQEVEELMDKIKGPAIFIQVGLSEIIIMFFHYQRSNKYEFRWGILEGR